MALSGTIPVTSNNQYIVGTLTWSAVQNITGNYSDVTAILRMWRTNTGYTTSGTGYFRLSIDGTSYTTSGSYSLSYNSNTLMISATKRVYHSTDGTKSLNISVVNGGNYSGIPSTSFTATYCSSTVVLDTIPRASLLNSFTAPLNLKTGTANSIDLYIHRYSPSFSHDITLFLGGVSIATWTAAAFDPIPTSYSLTKTQVNSILTRMPTSTSAVMTLQVQTRYNGANVGTAVSRTSTCTISADEKPTVPVLSHAEQNTAVSSQNIGAYVNTISRITLTAQAPTPPTGATISSLVIYYSGVATNVSTSGGSIVTSTINWDTPSSGEVPTSGDIKIRATDSRGRYTESPVVNLTAKSYKPPLITDFTVARYSNDTTPAEMGTYLKVVRTGTASSLLVGGTEKNTLTAAIYTKPKTSSEWGPAKAAWSATGTTSITSSVAAQSDYSNLVSYDVKFELSDKFNTSIAVATLPTGGIVMSWGTKGVGIGKVIVEDGRVLDIEGSAYLNGNLISDSSHTHSNYSLTTHTHSNYSLTTHSHNIFTLIQTKTMSTNLAFTTTHGTFQYRDVLTFDSYTPSTNGTVMINLNVNGYYGVAANYGFTRGRLYIRNSSTANSDNGTIETYYRIFMPTGTGTYDPQLFSESSVFMDVEADTTYRFKITSYGDNTNGGVESQSKASLYFIPKV